MGVKEFIDKAKNFLAREIRIFNAGEEAKASDMPFVANWFWTANLGIPRQINPVEVRQYGKSCWVQMVTNAILKQAATTEWDIVSQDEDEDLTKLEEDVVKIKQLLNFPNRNGDTFWDVFGPALLDVLEVDAGVIFKGRNAVGELKELFVYDGSRFLINLDEHGIIKEEEGFYQYSFRYPGNQPLSFKKNDIVYLQMKRNTEYHPYGFSPLQAIQQEVELLIQSSRWNKEFFKNNATPDGIVTVPMEFEKMEHFKDQWYQQVKGKPHKLLFHNAEGATFTPFNLSNKDMQWLDGQKWFFHIVFGAYGLSPQEVGFYEDSSRATGESQERITVKNAIKPYLLMLENKINREIIPEIVGHDKLRFEFYIADDVKEKLEHDQTMQKLQAGVLTINEVRNMEGKDDVEWGDKPLTLFMQENFQENNNEDRDAGKDEDKDEERDRDEDKEESDKTKTLYVKLFNKFLKREEVKIT